MCNDGSKDRPVKSINQAVALANRRKFIGTAQCYIRLLSDYTIGNTSGVPDAVSLYHPDLVQNKYMYLEGWDKDTDSMTRRKIRNSPKYVTVNYKVYILMQCCVKI